MLLQFEIRFSNGEGEERDGRISEGAIEIFYWKYLAEVNWPKNVFRYHLIFS